MCCCFFCVAICLRWLRLLCGVDLFCLCVLRACARRAGPLRSPAAALTHRSLLHTPHTHRRTRACAWATARRARAARPFSASTLRSTCLSLSLPLLLLDPPQMSCLLRHARPPTPRFTTVATFPFSFCALIALFQRRRPAPRARRRRTKRGNARTHKDSRRARVISCVLVASAVMNLRNENEEAARSAGVRLAARRLAPHAHAPKSHPRVARSALKTKASELALIQRNCLCHNTPHLTSSAKQWAFRATASTAAARRWQR